MNPIIELWMARIAHGAQTIPPIAEHSRASENDSNDTRAALPNERTTPTMFADLEGNDAASARESETRDSPDLHQTQAVDDALKPSRSRVTPTVTAIGAVLLISAAVLFVAQCGHSTTSHSRTNANSFSATAIQDLPKTGAARGPTAIGVIPPPGFTNVIIAKNVGSIIGNVCQGGTLHLSWTLVGIAPATQVVIALNGRGLPPQLTFRASPNEPFGRDFPVSGAGQWSDTILSIGGKPPPASGSHDLIPVQC
jgi:hypothetical protein